jgi:hypothetical protein
MTVGRCTLAGAAIAAAFAAPSAAGAAQIAISTA